MFAKEPQGMQSIKGVSAMQKSAQPFCITLLIATLLFSIFPQRVWSANAISSAESKPRKTVAAGFGFQDTESSSITVKTYDAESGEVLSAETYELDIKDDGPPSSHPRARVFAGGVGLDSDGLSDFTLRVYDAANGRFLWEGRLNLGIGDNPEMTAHQVLAHVHPRSVVVKTAGQANHPGQPYFVLRAVSQETGQLIWADEFSANPAQVHMERIGRSIIGMIGAVPQAIDFCIKMPDDSGRRLLWEDKVVPIIDGEEAAVQRSDEVPGILPGWPQDAAETSQKDAV
jgi:hypothetical protein